MKVFIIILIPTAIIIAIIIKILKNKKNKETKKVEPVKNDYVDDRYINFLNSIIVNNHDRTILGTIMINGKREELSEKKEENKYIYYLKNEIIGVYNPDVMGDNLIVFRENSLENQLSDQIKDEITQIINKTKKRKQLERERNITRIKNQNVYQQQKGYQESIGQKKQQENYLNKLKVQSQKKRENETERQLKAKQNKFQNKVNDINIKQEVDMNTMATDMDTIGKRLENAGKIKGKEKEGKLAFVESDDLKKLKDEKGNKLQGHESRYEAVVINKDGTVRSLDLENDTQEGNNPTERNYQIKQNKNEKIEKSDVLTRLKIKGSETIGIEKGQYGEVEVYHSHDKTIGGKGIEGNQSLDKQLETKNSKNAIEGTDQAMQKLSQKYQDGYRSVEDSYQEAKEHENIAGEPECKEAKVEDLDGNPNTISHSHTDEIIAKLMKNSEISDKFTEKEIRERVERKWEQKDSEMTKEEFQKNMEEDIEIDAENMRGGRER